MNGQSRLILRHPGRREALKKSAALGAAAVAPLGFPAGEIRSAAGLAIGEQALRLKTPYFNTGCNSDELRGKNCNRFAFFFSLAAIAAWTHAFPSRTGP